MSREQPRRVVPPHSHSYSHSIPIPIPDPIPIPVPRAPGRFPRCRPPPGRPPPPPGWGHPRPPCAPGSAPSFSPLVLFPSFSCLFPPPPPTRFLFSILFCFGVSSCSCFIFLLLFFHFFPSLPSDEGEIPAAAPVPVPAEAEGSGQEAAERCGARSPQPHSGHCPPFPGMQVGWGAGSGSGGNWGRLSGGVGGKANPWPPPSPKHLRRFGGLPRCGGWGTLTLSLPTQLSSLHPQTGHRPCWTPSPSARTPQIPFFSPQ